MSNEETVAHHELDTLWKHIVEEKRAERISKDKFLENNKNNWGETMCHRKNESRCGTLKTADIKEKKPSMIS